MESLIVVGLMVSELLIHLVEKKLDVERGGAGEESIDGEGRRRIFIFPPRETSSGINST